MALYKSTSFLPSFLTVKVKVKVWTLVIAPLTRVRLVTRSALQSRKWQLIDMSQWCMPQHIMWPSIARANGQLDPWCSQQTHHRPNQPHQAFTLQPQLILISGPAEGRRLSWPEHTVGQQLAQGCFQWTGCESNPQPLGYESDTLPTGPLH